MSQKTSQKRERFLKCSTDACGNDVIWPLIFQVLVDFESRLPSADFVAIDTELTGVDLEVACQRRWQAFNYL